MITVDHTAQIELQKLLSENHFPGIRIKVMGGGCSGFMTHFDFDYAKENDKVFDFNGGKVFVDPKSYLYVQNSLLKFSGGLNGRGFELEVEGAKKTCGCGQSFSV